MMEQAKLSKVCSTSKETINPLLYPETKFQHYSIPAFDNLQLPELVAGEEIQSNKLVLNEPCILFSRLNPRIKRVWDLTGEKLQPNSVGSTEWVPFIVKDAGVLHPRYLFWFLHSDYFVTIARGNVRAATKSRERVNKDDLFGINIPLPPLAEQKRIARILDVAAAIQTQRRATLTHLDTLLQSTFLHMFGDPVTNSMRWKFHQLSEFFSKEKEGTKCGPFGSALKREEYVDEGIPVWIMDNIRDMLFQPSGCLYITPQKYKQLESYSTTSGDIIISRAGTVGKMCVVEADGTKSVISTNLIRLSLDDNWVDPYYFVSLMTFCKGRVGRLKTGEDGDYSFMNTGALKKLTIPVPPIQVQRNYRKILHRLREHRQTLERDLARLDTLFQSLQQRAFRGELSPSP